MRGVIAVVAMMSLFLHISRVNHRFYYRKYLLDENVILK